MGYGMLFQGGQQIKIFLTKNVPPWLDDEKKFGF